MHIEYEAKFLKVDTDELRKRLRDAGAILMHPEALMKRVTFKLPVGDDVEKYARVRQEHDKITMTYKHIHGDSIEDQKEINIEIDNFDYGVEFLKLLGCTAKAYQENKRETWHLDDAEVCIDEWPFLDPYVEIEAENEHIVRAVSEKLGFKWGEAMFGSVGSVFAKVYTISVDRVVNHTPKIVFDMENPFVDSNE